MTDLEQHDLEHRKKKSHERLVKEVETVLMARRSRRERILELTQSFTEQLFQGLQTAVYDLRQRGLTELGEPRLIDHPAGSRRALQINIEDWTIIFVPLVGVARPNLRDEAQIPPLAFKELCGRIAVFIGSDPEQEAFFDFLILSDGSWFAWGYGWPRQDDTMDHTDFNELAYELLNSFIQDIFVTWRTRNETTLGAALDARRRAYNYGLPGDEH